MKRQRGKMLEEGPEIGYKEEVEEWKWSEIERNWKYEL